MTSKSRIVLTECIVRKLRDPWKITSSLYRALFIFVDHSLGSLTLNCTQSTWRSCRRSREDCLEYGKKPNTRQRTRNHSLLSLVSFGLSEKSFRELNNCFFWYQFFETISKMIKEKNLKDGKSKALGTTHDTDFIATQPFPEDLILVGKTCRNQNYQPTIWIFPIRLFQLTKVRGNTYINFGKVGQLGNVYFAHYESVRFLLSRSDEPPSETNCAEVTSDRHGSHQNAKYLSLFRFLDEMRSFGGQFADCWHTVDFLRGPNVKSADRTSDVVFQTQ